MSELLSKHCRRILSMIDKISLSIQTQTELTEKNEKYNLFNKTNWNLFLFLSYFLFILGIQY